MVLVKYQYQAGISWYTRPEWKSLDYSPSSNRVPYDAIKVLRLPGALLPKPTPAHFVPKVRTWVRPSEEHEEQSLLPLPPSPPPKSYVAASMRTLRLSLSSNVVQSSPSSPSQAMVEP